jgi:hypothetical protein
LSYAGTIATALLGVYALVRKRTLDIEESNEQLYLNRSGKKYVVGLVLISVFTVASTVVKDVADGQLSFLAKESAEQDLRKVLGGSFEGFARQHLTPAINGLTADVYVKTHELNRGIDSAIAKLDTALGGAIADIKQSTLESARKHGRLTLRSLPIGYKSRLSRNQRCRLQIATQAESGRGLSLPRSNARGRPPKTRIELLRATRCGRNWTSTTPSPLS